MKHKELTEKIIKCCFEVINELGSGFLENVYERALAIVLKQEGLSFQTQVPLKVKFRGEIIGEYCADVVVEDTVLLELKAIRELLPIHKAQVINYLKATGKEVGLLINFGKPKLEFKRVYIE